MAVAIRSQVEDHGSVGGCRARARLVDVGVFAIGKRLGQNVGIVVAKYVPHMRMVRSPCRCIIDERKDRRKGRRRAWTLSVGGEVRRRRPVVGWVHHLEGRSRMGGMGIGDLRMRRRGRDGMR